MPNVAFATKVATEDDALGRCMVDLVVLDDDGYGATTRLAVESISPLGALMSGRLLFFGPPCAAVRGTAVTERMSDVSVEVPWTMVWVIVRVDVEVRVVVPELAESAPLSACGAAEERRGRRRMV